MKNITVPEYSIKGEKLGTVLLPENLFGITVSPSLLALAVNVYRSNQRQGTRKAQLRSEVSRTTAKAYRQKGTGKARHGSRRAHIFVGGGVAHGPKANANFSKTLSKRMRRRALLGALSLRVKDNNLVVMNNLDSIQNKTKDFTKILAKVVDYPKTRKVLVILPQVFEGIINASSNLSGVTITQAKRLNTYEILHANTIILAQDAIEILRQTYSGTKPGLVDINTEIKKTDVKVSTKKTADKSTKTVKPSVKKTVPPKKTTSVKTSAKKAVAKKAAK